MRENDIPASRRTSLHEEVAQRLRDMILNRTLQPGDKIDESALCAQFDVSRTPLREALKVLSMEGYIVLTARRGARVAVTSISDVRDLFPVIGALEALAGELACQQVNEQEILLIQSLHDLMIAAHQRGDQAGYARCNRDIHLSLFRIAGNPALTTLYHQLSARTHAVRHVAKKSPDDWQAAIADHEAMLVALRQRNGAALATILKQHLARKAQMVIAWLETQSTQ